MVAVMTLAERNKGLVLRGFQEFAAGNIEILRTLLHEDFIEHNPANPSGRDAYVDFVATSRVAGAKLDLERIIADDQYVVVHYRMTTPAEFAVADIWRLADGRIVEHWDVVQPLPR